MILPSDEDSRKPDDDPDDGLPWEDGDEVPGFFGEEPEAEQGEAVHHPAPAGWREDLREDLHDALAELKEIEDPAEDFDPPEPPDLFAFFGELLTIRQYLQQSAGAPVPPASPLPNDGKDIVAAVLLLHDQFEDENRTLLPLLAPVMKAAGLIKIKVKAGAAFDPASMTTADPVRKDSKVAREIFSGWKFAGHIIRPAEVALK